MGSSFSVNTHQKRIKMKFLLVLFLAGAIAVSAVPAETSTAATDAEFPLVKDFLEISLLLKGDLSEAYFLKQLRQDDDSLLKFHYFRKHFNSSPIEAFLLTERFYRLGNFKVLMEFLEKMETV